MGGDMQPQGHVQILVNLIDFGMNAAGGRRRRPLAPRGLDRADGEEMTDGGEVYVESGVPWNGARAEGKGHDVRTDVGGYGGYQAIARDPATGFFLGATEKRKDGAAAGF